MHAYQSDRFTIELPPGHRFPMQKYARLRMRLGAASRHELVLAEAPCAHVDDLLLAHSREYVMGFIAGRLSSAALRRLGLPWSQALVERSLRAVGATMAAVRCALDDGVAVSLAGGTHHADGAAGAGFCVFNDAAIAALAALRDGRVQRILVVDCDVHQGDGTARILAAVPQVYTFSIHSARNYPHAKASSDCDIGLPDGCADDDYLAALELGLTHSLRAARPELVIYNAGADPYAGDALGRLALSKAGLGARDDVVFTAVERSAAGIAVVMGGGYADDIDETVDIHCQTVIAALASHARRQRRATG